jgi:hypothetical protein
MKTSTTHSYCEDDTPNENDILNIDANKNESYLMDGVNRQCRKRITQVFDNEADGDSLSEYDSDADRQSDENDLLTTNVDARTVASAV